MIAVQFIGGGLSRGSLLKEQQGPYQEITCAPLSLAKPLKVPLQSLRILRGVLQSLRFMRRARPDLLIGFGSYYTLPVLAAARLAGIPYILHEQNAIPGRVNRLFSRSAHKTAIAFPAAAAYLNGNVAEIAFSRRELRGSENPFHYFALSDDLPVLLVFGGSQGAGRINQLLLEGVEGVDSRRFQILHFTGDTVWTERLKTRYASLGIRSCVKEFEPRMDLAWQIARLTVSRSGAGTIAEQLQFAVPAVLIPYPYAMDNHQEANAEFMAETVGGGVVRKENGLKPMELLAEVRQLLAGGQGEAMRNKIKDYRQNNAKPDFVSLVMDSL